MDGRRVATFATQGKTLNRIGLYNNHVAGGMGGILTALSESLHAPGRMRCRATKPLADDADSRHVSPQPGCRFSNNHTTLGRTWRVETTMQKKPRCKRKTSDCRTVRAPHTRGIPQNRTNPPEHEAATNRTAAARSRAKLPCRGGKPLVFAAPNGPILREILGEMRVARFRRPARARNWPAGPRGRYAVEPAITAQALCCPGRDPRWPASPNCGGGGAVACTPGIDRQRR
jgi:hypothetical protein